MATGQEEEEKSFLFTNNKCTDQERENPVLKKSRDRNSGKTILLKLRSNSTAAGKQDLNMRLIPKRRQATVIPANFLHQILVWSELVIIRRTYWIKCLQKILGKHIFWQKKHAFNKWLKFSTTMTAASKNKTTK